MLDSSNKKLETTTFAAGCFWGVEEAFHHLPGVISTMVGYTGGRTADPTYEEVCSGQTGQAEAVQITYDPRQISYEQLLKVFWENHDPTMLNRQGPDVGEQYRSVIFYHTPKQQATALQSKEALERLGKYQRPIVTQILPAGPFYKAEEYHQLYLEKRGLSSCRI